MELKEILLVDEKSPILGNISRILQDWGYLVMVAPDAMTALENVQNFQFDLIVVSLGGNEVDKLNLMRWARRSSPQSKLIVVGSPKSTLPVEVFQFEVDDYLLAPFTAMELSTRVDRCLNDNNVVPGNSEEKADLINGSVLNSLIFKIRNIHNGLLSLKARVNTLIDQKYSLLADGNVHKISHDILILTNVTENILYNMLVCCNEKEDSSIERDYTVDYFNNITFTQFN